MTCSVFAIDPTSNQPIKRQLADTVGLIDWAIADFVPRHKGRAVEEGAGRLSTVTT